MSSYHAILLFLVLINYSWCENVDYDSSNSSDHTHHSHHQEEGKHGLECYKCVYSPSAEARGDPACLHPENTSVTTVTCEENQACGLWIGNTSLGYTVLRACSVHPPNSSDCRTHEKLKQSLVNYHGANGSLSVNDMGVVAGIRSEWCSEKLCNYGLSNSTCASIHTVGLGKPNDHDQHKGHTGTAPSSHSMFSILSVVLIAGFLVPVQATGHL